MRPKLSMAIFPPEAPLYWANVSALNDMLLNIAEVEKRVANEMLYVTISELLSL